MGNFKLKKHSVKEAYFIENKEKEKKHSVEVGLGGSILTPKDYEQSKYVAVQLKFYFGNPEERLYLTLETLSTFEVERQDTDFHISEEIVHEACLPVALAELRKTVKKVTEAYGMPALDLPPFEGEN